MRTGPKIDMVSLTEKDLFVIFVELDKSALPMQPKLPLPDICAKVKAELKTDSLDDNHVAIIENSVRKYRTLKRKHHKELGYNYIIEKALDKIQLSNDENEQQEGLVHHQQRGKKKSMMKSLLTDHGHCLLIWRTKGRMKEQMK